MESFKAQWAGVLSPSFATCPNRATRREEMRSEMCGRPVLSVIIVFLILSCHLTPRYGVDSAYERLVIVMCLQPTGSMSPNRTVVLIQCTSCRYEDRKSVV